MKTKKYLGKVLEAIKTAKSDTGQVFCSIGNLYPVVGVSSRSYNHEDILVVDDIGELRELSIDRSSPNFYGKWYRLLR